MYGRKHAQIGPVCKFGPGGDFVSIWPERFAGLYQPGPAYTGVAAGDEGDGRLPAQPMLFADDFRTAGANQHKPKRRIRAYRRAAKKKVHLEFSRQGSLFAADAHCAKTA